MTDFEYPELAEGGQEEAVALIEHFKTDLEKAAKEAISNLYCDILPYIDSDSWMNFGNAILGHLCDYHRLRKHQPYNAQKIRQAIFKQFREEILPDLNQDLVEEVELLKEQLESARMQRRDW